MAKYLVSHINGVPYCSVCGKVIPECGPNAININPTEIQYCYFCGSSIDRFYYPEGEED